MKLAEKSVRALRSVTTHNALPAAEKLLVPNTVLLPCSGAPSAATPPTYSVPIIRPGGLAADAEGRKNCRVE